MHGATQVVSIIYPEAMFQTKCYIFSKIYQTRKMLIYGYFFFTRGNRNCTFTVIRTRIHNVRNRIKSGGTTNLMYLTVLHYLHNRKTCSQPVMAELFMTKC